MVISNIFPNIVVSRPENRLPQWWEECTPGCLLKVLSDMCYVWDPLIWPGYLCEDVYLYRDDILLVLKKREVSGQGNILCLWKEKLVSLSVRNTTNIVKLIPKDYSL